MVLYLRPGTSIKTVQKAFSSTFPFLKIEFFKSPHDIGEGTGLKDKIPPDTQFRDIIPAVGLARIPIRPDCSVAEVEQLFQEKFHLPVQIFRKGRGVWLETTQTDLLTLKQQNALGKESNKEYRIINDFENIL